VSVRGVVRVCGQPATGKTTLGRMLARALSLPFYSIDAERRVLMPWGGFPEDSAPAWAALARKVQGAEACIVETSGLDARDGVVLRGKRVFTIMCIAHHRVRAARLAARVRDGYGLSIGVRDYVRTLLRLRHPSVRADLTVDTSAGLPPSMLSAILVPLGAALGPSGGMPLESPGPFA
jgi:hypothetical protein